MLKHSDILQKLNTLQKIAIVASGLKEEELAKAGLPPVHAARLDELGERLGVRYQSALRSFNPRLIEKMTEELTAKGGQEGSKLFITPDLKTAVNPYEEGLSEDPYLNGVMGGEILKAIKSAGGASGLYRPSASEREVSFLDVRENGAAVHELLVKPFIMSVEKEACDALFADPSREGKGYYAVNRAIFNEAQSGLFGEPFIVGDGNYPASDAVSLLSGKVTLGGCAIPLGRAAERFEKLTEYEREGSVAHRETEEALRDGSAINSQMLDEAADAVIDFVLALQKLEVRGDNTAGFAADTADEILTDIPAEPTAPAPATADDVPPENTAATDGIAPNGTADVTEETSENVAATSEDTVENATSASNEDITSNTNTTFAHASAESSTINSASGVKPAAAVAAEESIVLLKNSGILPLKEGAKIAVLGYAYSDVSALSARYAVTGAAKGYDHARARSDSYLPAALRATNGADAVLVFLTSDAAGRELALPPNRIALLDAVKKAGKRAIAVVLGDLPVDMSFDGLVDALLLAPADGPFAGEALARIISGEANPSGKLTRTLIDGADGYFRSLRADKDGGRTRIGVFTGYRRYLTEGKKARYPFGFGLSYTRFRYSDCTINSERAEFTLTNCGSADGAEVVQLYVGVPSSSRVQPVKQLRAFQKVFLKAGESRRVTIPLTDKTFESYDPAVCSDDVEEGEYALYIGSSSQDIRLTCKLRRGGVERVALGERRADYFPDGDFGDAGEVARASRIRRQRPEAPEKIKNARTAVLYAMPAVALVFFILVSTVILAYALDYILLSYADAMTVEWALYVIAVGVLALFPLLGSLNRKRLVRVRTVAFVVTPLLIAVCFVLGGILLSGNGGTAEDVAFRIVTCFAVGTPIAAVVAFLLERQLYKTKTGENRWDKYYFVRDGEREVTPDAQFEDAFSLAEEERARRAEIVAESEEPAPVREAVRFYDKQLTYVQMLKDLSLFLKERGLAVEDDSLKNYVAAIFSSRLVIVPKGGGAALATAAAEYFGKRAYIDNAEGYERYSDMFMQWKKGGNASYPTNLSVALVMARRESAFLHTVVLRHVKKSALGSLFAPFADVLSRRREALPAAGGKELRLPPNVLVVVEVEDESAFSIPPQIAEVAASVAPTAAECEPAARKSVMQAVGFERMEAMLTPVRDYYPLDEELWKKVDLLDEKCRAAHIGNRLWIKLETHSAILMACGGDANYALDGAIASELSAWLSSVWNGEADGELTATLEEIFGEGRLPRTAAALKGGEGE